MQNGLYSEVAFVKDILMFFFVTCNNNNILCCSDISATSYKLNKSIYQSQYWSVVTILPRCSHLNNLVTTDQYFMFSLILTIILCPVVVRRREADPKDWTTEVL